MHLKKVLFMGGKLRNDLRSFRREIPIFRGPYDSSLQAYYIVFNSDFKSLNRLLHSFDENGIPLNTTYIDVESPSLHYYPISIGQYALARWHDYLRGDMEAGEHFMRIAEWFYDRAVLSDYLGAYWLTEVPKPEYEVYASWKSAFTQSRAISVLLRAWQKTGKERFLTRATSALIPYTKDISEGGVSVDRAIGSTFFEEYVAALPTRVLDGHIFSLFGLYDYIRAVTPQHKRGHSELAQTLWEEGITGLLDNISYYDTGEWLRFNRCDLPGYPNEDPCTIGYMKLVIAQMEVLFCITQKEKFRELAERWKGYLTPKGIFRMYRLKLNTLKQLNRL